jgi:gas vesicle protein
VLLPGLVAILVGILNSLGGGAPVPAHVAPPTTPPPSPEPKMVSKPPEPVDADQPPGDLPHPAARRQPNQPPVGAERFIEESVRNGQEFGAQVGETSKAVGEALKDARDNIEQLNDTLNEITNVAANLDLSPEARDAIGRQCDALKAQLEGADARLKSVGDRAKSVAEVAETVTDVMGRVHRVVKTYNDMMESTPEYLNERSRQALSTYGAAIQAAGETADLVIRRVPEVGDLVADTLDPRGVAQEGAKAIGTAARNYTHQQRRFAEEVDKIARIPEHRRTSDGQELLESYETLYPQAPRRAQPSTVHEMERDMMVYDYMSFPKGSSRWVQARDYLQRNHRNTEYSPQALDDAERRSYH